MSGVFIGVNGTSNNLEKLVWHQAEAGQPAGRPGRAGSTNFLHRLSFLLLVGQPRLRPNRLKPWSASQGVGPAGQPRGPLDLGSGPLGPRVEYTPVAMMILTFGQLYFVIP
jgi:hypothetical protein